MTPAATTAALVFLLALAHCAVAYPNGGPINSCLDMQPYHKKSTGGYYAPTVSTTMYRITTVSKNWTKGGTVQVVLDSPTSKYFEGFVLTAVRATSNFTDMNLGPLLGSFNCSNSHNRTLLYHSMYSPTNESNCVTHASKAHYTSLTCTWTAPATNEGPIKFVATAVEEFEVYVHVQSEQLPNVDGNPPNSAAVATMNSVPSMMGCGTTKTCALYPQLCDKRGSCTHGVMMTVRSDSSLLFEMFGTTVQWIGLGLADNTKMESTELFTCAYDSVTSKTLLKLDYSPDENVKPVCRTEIRNRATMVNLDSADGTSLPRQPNVIACQFVRPRIANFTYYEYSKTTQTSTPVRVVKDMADGLYAVLAQGQLIGTGSKNMAKHSIKPLKSPKKFTTNSVNLMYFAGISVKVQTHATLMTISWLFLVGLAIVAARHQRPVLNQKLVLGKDLWFLLHVCSILIGFFLSISGIVYIIVAEGGWESGSQTHGIIGIIGVSLALINIVAGVFRPEPGAKFRSLFNRLHRWNGLLSLLMSTVCMWLGATFEKHRPQFRFYAVIVLAVWTGLQVIFMVGFEIARQTKANGEKAEQALRRNRQYKMAAIDDKQKRTGQQEEEEKEVKGKWLVHVNSFWFLLYAGVFLALLVAFIAGLWLH